MSPDGSPTPAERARRFGETAIKTPANVITFMRLLFAIPVLVWILDQHDGNWGTFVGWLVLAFTDGLDGWLARRDGTTRSGAFLDPLADKILVTGAFVALAVRGDIAWLPVIIVIAREGGVQVWRTLAGRRGVSVPARRLGKWKAYVQFIAVGIVLFPPTEDAPHIYNAFLWLAVALSVVSAVDLIVAARHPEPGSTTPALTGAEPAPEPARPSPGPRRP
jgi:CDP-diacylglycerol---glycerol-3-phosphate 3-phosphatidyltransferase